MVQYQLFSQLSLLKGFCACVMDLVEQKPKTLYCECEATSLEFEKQQGQRAISSCV